MEILVLQVTSPLGDFLSCTVHYLYFYFKTFLLTHVFILFCIMQCFKVNMSFKMTSSIIPLNESNLSRSSGEMDFIFKACKVTQSFCVCVVSDVEVKKAMKKSLAVAVDCLC